MKGRREQVVVATKFGMISHAGRAGLDSSPASIRTAVEGAPAREVVATWVVAEDAALADGLATALFFTDPNRRAETFPFACSP